MSRVRVKEEKRCVVIHTSVKGKGKLQGEATHTRVSLITVFPPERSQLINNGQLHVHILLHNVQIGNVFIWYLWASPSLACDPPACICIYKPFILL